LGKSINEALINDLNACLITTPNFCTRINPTSQKASTIDLTITSLTITVSLLDTLLHNWTIHGKRPPISHHHTQYQSNPPN
jgi:hypothetical protein